MCPEKESSYPLNRRLRAPRSRSGLEVWDKTKISIYCLQSKSALSDPQSSFVIYFFCPIIRSSTMTFISLLYFVFSLFFAILYCLSFFKCLGKLLKVYGYSSSDHDHLLDKCRRVTSNPEEGSKASYSEARNRDIYLFYSLNYMFANVLCTF
jgi:hypothetical protein